MIGQHERSVAIKDVIHEGVMAAWCTVRVGSDGPDVSVVSGGLTAAQSCKMKANKAPNIRCMIARIGGRVLGPW